LDVTAARLKVDLPYLDPVLAVAPVVRTPWRGDWMHVYSRS
jgi:hypothetical protein